MEKIYNYLKINAGTFTSGQPTENQLRDAAAEGVQVVINLATLGSETTLDDEAGLVKSLGMDYIHIPVAWDKPTVDDFAAFLDAMESVAGKKVLIHCVANYRVTAFYSLYAMKILGWSKMQADDLMAKIWDDNDYAVWDAFVKFIRRN
jgi:protein tyrosine phosphatase (PTP) superfamily phosphohydrolase (DUF442 family)